MSIRDAYKEAVWDRADTFIAVMVIVILTLAGAGLAIHFIYRDAEKPPKKERRVAPKQTAVCGVRDA